MQQGGNRHPEGTAIVSANAPPNKLGVMWYDTGNNVLKVANGDGTWLSDGPTLRRWEFPPRYTRNGSATFEYWDNDSSTDSILWGERVSAGGADVFFKYYGRRIPAWMDCTTTIDVYMTIQVGAATQASNEDAYFQMLWDRTRPGDTNILDDQTNTALAVALTSMSDQECREIMCGTIAANSFTNGDLVGFTFGALISDALWTMGQYVKFTMQPEWECTVLDGYR